MKKYNLIYEKIEGERLDKFISGLSSINRNLAKELILDGKVFVNEIKQIKPSFILNLNDKIEFSYEENDSKKINLEPWENSNIIKIVKDSKDYLILNKPSGIVVHPAKAHETQTLANALVHEFNNLDTTLVNRPGIVHRLDKDTSGIIIISKNQEFTNKIQEQFKERKVKKIYIAFIEGKLNYKTGLIDAPIGKNFKNIKKLKINGDQAKEAKTQFKVLKMYDKYTLIAFYPLTGRTHQLRVHAKYIGHSILNDPIYSSNQLDGFENFGQFLHAYQISFNDLENNNVSYKSKPVKEFYEIEPNLDEILKEL